MATDPPAVIEVPTKPWNHSLTIWINIIATVGTIIGVLVDSALDLNIPPQTLVVIITAQSMVTVLLRALRANLPIGPEGGTRTVEVPR